MKDIEYELRGEMVSRSVSSKRTIGLQRSKEGAAAECVESEIGR